MTYFAATPRLEGPLLAASSPSKQLSSAVSRTETELENLLKLTSQALSIDPCRHDVDDLKVLQGMAICALASVDAEGGTLGLSPRAQNFRDGLDVIVNGEQATTKAQDLRTMVIANHGHGCSRLNKAIENTDDRNAVRTPLLVISSNSFVGRPLDLNAMIVKAEQEAAKPRVLCTIPQRGCPSGL